MKEMSRIQNILDKAEREGATLRTGRMGTRAAVPFTTAAPLDLDRPAPPVIEPTAARSIVPGAPAVLTKSHSSAASASAAPPADDAIASYSVRLSSLLVAGLAHK
jgi:hypothetical protein